MKYHLNHPTKKLGKRPPKLDRRTLKLSKYLKALPGAPIRAGYINKVPSFPMFLNDYLGDCAIAAPGHMIQQWTAYAGKPVTPTDNQILKAYEDVGGYIPGDSSTDNGCFMLDVLNYWRQTGIAGHKIVAYASVNPLDQIEMEQAIWLFGNLYVGVGLPLSAQDNTNPVPGGKPCWSVPQQGLNGSGSFGSWGGHAIPIVGYSNDPARFPGTEVVTWGEVYDMTWWFIHFYCDEAYAIVTQDWINSLGKSPTGLNLKQLLADLNTVTK